MKKILAVFLLLTIASVAVAQVEHGGLSIPGDGAVQVVRKRGAVPLTAPPYSRSGLVIEFLAQNYDFATGSTALWPNTGSLGGSATQSTEINKPLPYDPLYQRVTFNSSSTTGIKVGMSYAIQTINPPYTVMLAVSLKRNDTNQRVVFSGGGNNPRMDTNAGSVFFYVKNAGITAYIRNISQPYTATGTSALVSKADGSVISYYNSAKSGGDGAGTTTPLQGPVLAIGGYTIPPTANAASFHLMAFCVWSRELSASEIQSAHNAMLTYFGSNLNDTTGLP